MNLKESVIEHNVLTIVGYLRKSRQDIEREKRTGEDTLSEQKELMNNVLTSIELPYELKMEIGSGENIDGRPVFQEVLKDLENGKYQAIAVKEISRLSRGNMGDAQRILDLIKDSRLIIITPYKIYDVRNPTDFRQIRFELFLAREEYEMIKERMVNARYVYATQGKWVAGKSPYGYSYNKKTQKLEINQDEAKIVRMIYDLFMNGLNGTEVSYQAIATYLTKLGIPTPRNKRTWSYDQVRRILKNDLYIGIIRFRTTETLKNGKRTDRPKSEHIYVEDAHEAIIDKELWDKVALKIKNKLPQPHNPLDFSPNELASVCTCWKCGGKLVRNCGTRKYKKKNDEESEYVQEFLKCQKEKCMSVKYRDVEDAILESLKYISELDNEQLNMFLDNLIKEKELNNGSDTTSQMLEQLDQKEKELVNRMDFIFDKYEKGIYTDEIFLQRKEAIDKEKSEIEKAKKELQGIDTEKEVKPLENIRRDIINIIDTYQTSSYKEEKNRILREVFEHVEVEILEKGKGRKPAKFEITPNFRYNIFTQNP